MRVAAVVLAVSLMTPDAHSAAPPTRRDDVVETLHGVEIHDPYRWLEDQDAPETRSWIAAQEAYARATLSAMPEREAVRRLVTPFFHSDEVGVPWTRPGRLFFTRRLPDEQLASIVMREGLHGRDRVLVDPRTVDAAGKSSVSIAYVTKDGSRLAYAVRHGGADEEEIRTIDPATGREVAERMPLRRYLGFALTPDGKSAYYVTYGDEGPRVRRHDFGTDVASDPLVFGDKLAEGLGVGADLSDDGRWLVLTVWHGSAAKRSDVYAKRLQPDGPIVTIVDDVEARFEPSVVDGKLVVNTNWMAPNGRVLEIDLERPARENWRELIPESKWPLLEAGVVDNRIVTRSLQDVRPVVSVYSRIGRLERTIESPGFGAQSGIMGEHDRGPAFMTYSSWDHPESIETIDVATGKRETWWQSNLPFPRDRFVVEQVWFKSSDGARVPMFLAHAKGAKPSGAPTLVTGYGGFVLSQLPTFNYAAAAWLEMGGVVALPSLRGGGEFGERWHEQGMLAHKQQTFDDLYAAADWLVESGWSRHETLAIRGRSNGGLLVGAAVTQRPDAFRAAVCGYPLLDMLRYDKFLVAKFWVPEYGSADDAEQFGWLRKYSPYHNVRQGPYPAVLFVTGDADTRVAPLHARKMAALLQASQTADHPVLLHYDTEMGHSGGLPADKEIEDLADEIGFLAHETGLGAPAPR